MPDGSLDHGDGDGDRAGAQGQEARGDGRADLVTAYTDGNVYVYPGQASGAFGSGVDSFSGTFDAANHDGTGHYMVGVADVTGDGRADLVTAHENGAVPPSVVSVWLYGVPTTPGGSRSGRTANDGHTTLSV